MMTPILEDPRFVEAIDLFNRGEFFACHDLLEEIWSERIDEQRQFLQGLIHAAVSLFHFSEGNLGGARRMYDSTLAYLTPWLPTCCGLDLERFLLDYKNCFARLVQHRGSYPSQLTINIQDIPGLYFVVPPQA